MYDNDRKKNDSQALIYGVKPVLEAFRAEKQIDRIYLDRDVKNPDIAEIIKLAHAKDVPVFKVPDFKLNKITQKNHQGIIAYTSLIGYASVANVVQDLFEQGKNPFILILDRITDVRNFGAIARTAECAGVHAIVIPERESAQVNGDAFKTSAGALAIIPVCREKKLLDTVKYLQNAGVQVVACTEKTPELFHTVDYTIPTAIVMGSEEDGISDDIIKRADKLARIPLMGKIESLNVSVAAGVIIYEALRQRLQ
jgi:23S rRNA (guanosine2251-2'-O)-methyltransferase